MPKTPHPNKSASSSQVTFDSFTEAVNTKLLPGQASVTKALTSRPGEALGSGGETQAFSKSRVIINSQNQDSGQAVAFANSSGALFTNDQYANDSTLGGDRGLLRRGVATYQVDKLVGIGSIAEEKFGIDSSNQTIGVSIQADGSGISSKDGILQVNYRDPRIQRGLYDLEASDYITGQIDRHLGNIFIDTATGKVTGIDNDLGFPEADRNGLLAKDASLNGKMVTGMPRFMHEETARKILATKPEDLRALLKQPPPKGGGLPLSNTAIEGAVSRLQEMQAELRNPTGKITRVNAFDDNTYNTAIATQKTAFESYRNGPHDWDNPDPNTSFQALMSAPRTSYLGNAMLSVKGNSVAGDQAQALHNDSPKATRNLDTVAYNRMTTGEKRLYDEDHKLLNKLEGDMDKLQAEREHLAHPGRLDKMRGFGKGGVDGLKRKNDLEIDALQTNIDNLKTQMGDKITAKLLPTDLPQVGNVNNNNNNNGVQAPRHGAGNAAWNNAQGVGQGGGGPMQIGGRRNVGGGGGGGQVQDEHESEEQSHEESVDQTEEKELEFESVEDESQEESQVIGKGKDQDVEKQKAPTVGQQMEKAKAKISSHRGTEDESPELDGYETAEESTTQDVDNNKPKVTATTTTTTTTTSLPLDLQKQDPSLDDYIDIESDSESIELEDEEVAVELNAKEKLGEPKPKVGNVGVGGNGTGEKSPKVTEEQEHHPSVRETMGTRPTAPRQGGMALGKHRNGPG